MTVPFFTTTVRVYYEDTDLAGVVYYANYLKYIERGRSEMLRSLHIDQSLLKKDHGLVFVVRNVIAHYHISAVFDDELLIKTSVQKIKGASLHMIQEVLCADKVLFTADVGIVCVKISDFKPARIPSEIMMKLPKCA